MVGVAALEVCRGDGDGELDRLVATAQGLVVETAEQLLADLDRAAEVTALAVAPAQRDAAGEGVLPVRVLGQKPLPGGHRLVDLPHGFQSARSEHSRALRQLAGGLVQAIGERQVEAVESRVRLPRLERQLGEVDLDAQRGVAVLAGVGQQRVDGDVQPLRQLDQHPAVRPALPGLDPGDVADGDVVTAELALGHPGRQARSAHAAAEQGWVDRLQLVGLTRVHAASLHQDLVKFPQVPEEGTNRN